MTLEPPCQHFFWRLLSIGDDNTVHVLCDYCGEKNSLLVVSAANHKKSPPKRGEDASNPVEVKLGIT